MYTSLIVIVNHDYTRKDIPFGNKRNMRQQWPFSYNGDVVSQTWFYSFEIYGDLASWIINNLCIMRERFISNSHKRSCVILNINLNTNDRIIYIEKIYNLLIVLRIKLEIFLIQT